MTISAVLLALAAASSATAPAVVLEPGPRIAPAPLVGPGRIGPPADPIVPPAKNGVKADFLIDACMQAAMQRHDTPGAVVAVIRGGEEIARRGYGVKRRGGDDPIGPDTVFRIGSVTKQLTAAAVMQQVEIGAVDLDDPVTFYVPELALSGRWPADLVSVRDLLTQVSGYPDSLGDLSQATDDGALSRWAADQTEVALHAPPGRFWNYSNPNFMLAGLVVERASGIPYREYMETRLFDVADLEHTTFDPAAVIAAGDYSPGHFTNPGTGLEVVYEPDSYDNGPGAPAGWAFSTAGDLAAWALTLADGGGDVLSLASAEAMQAPHEFIDAAPASWYGYGIFVELYEGLEVRQHGGNVPGWGTYLLWVPERRDVVAVIANTFESLPDAAYCILDHVLGVPGGGDVVVDPEPQPPASLLGRYSGFNSLGWPFATEVTLDDGRLLLELWQVDNPFNRGSGRLVQAFRDTYVVDLDGDGTYDLDLTFLTSEGTPGRTSWLVNRSVVFQREVAPRWGRRP